MAADLHHATFRRDISVQDDQSSRFLQRLIEWGDYWLAGRLDRSTSLLRERPSGNRERGAVCKLGIEQTLGDYRDAACLIHVGSHVFSRGLQVRE